MTGRAFYRPDVWSTEMLIIDTDSLGISALLLTAQPNQGTIKILNSFRKQHTSFDVVTKQPVQLIYKITNV